MKLTDLVSYLNEYLAVSEVPDWKSAFNGLQVEGREEVRKIATCVDAALATIERAVDRGADLMIVHHGLFWGATAPVTGMYYRRLRALIKNDLALYSCHTPLDAHPEVGNNHLLARQLGLTVTGKVGKVEGVPLGVIAEADESLDGFVDRIRALLGVEPLVMRSGGERVRKVGIITGGAGNHIGEVFETGCDTFVTGEGPHHTYFDAEERGINVLYAGHYATETVGVKALGEHLQDRFGLETFFIDHPTGL